MIPSPPRTKNGELDRWLIGTKFEIDNYIQTLSVPVSSFSDGGGTRRSAFIGKHPAWLLNAGTQTASFEFTIPRSISKFKEARIRLVPVTTGTFDYTVNFQYGAVGEAYNASSKTDSATGEAATDGLIQEVDLPISTFFTDLVGGDQLAIEFVLDGLTTTTGLYILNFYLKYI